MHQLENKVIYQIYPKSYKDTTSTGVGDINGIIEKLDYLKELGVDYLWLSPCCKSPQTDNGYDISDYLTIDPMFGDNEDYYNLIAEAKKRGMKVMMDLVLNHTSTEHEWFKKAEELDEKYYNYYIWADEPNELTSFFEGSTWKYSEKVGKYYFHLFDETQADLNWSNPEVRKDIYDTVNTWIERGVEGFRLDVIDLIGKEPEKLITAKGPKFYEYLQELSTSTFGDKLLTVGECWGSTIEESYAMCNDKALTQAFHFTPICTHHDGEKWHHIDLDVQKLCECFDLWQNEYKGIEAVVMNNHDTPRLLSVWLDDQKYRKEGAKLLITVFGLQHGNLYIYQGEEIGMRNTHCKDITKYVDVETINVHKRLLNDGYSREEAMEKIAKTSRDNGRIPMAWDCSEHGGFSDVTPWIDLNQDYKNINVEDDLASEDSVYRYYQEIIKFRKENYEMLKEKATFVATGKVYEMKKGSIRIVANFSSENQAFTPSGKVIFGNYRDESDVLRPYEVLVYQM